MATKPNNRRKMLLGVTVIVLAAIALPPLIRSLGSEQERTLEAVTLDEVTYESVSFHNDAQGIDLAGMYLVPDGAGPHPAAVIIHGSGTSSRDNRWYLTLAQHLQDSGVAVLLPDKRGSELSGGDWRTASYVDLATDTSAAVEFLRTRDDIRTEAIGVIGMSQGGQIVPIVASGDDSLAWVVNVTGSALPARSTLRFEEKNNLRSMGFLPVISDALAYPSSWSLTAIRDDDFWDAVGDFDPLPYWEATEQPTLVVYGSDDSNVPTEASTTRLQTLDKSNIVVEVYEGSGHAIEDPVGNSLFRTDALDSISDFIAENS